MSCGLLLVAATLFSANAGMVRGVVEDDSRRPTPIAGAVVTLTNSGDKYTDTTDETGAYRISVDGGGTFSISVTKAGYTPDPNNDPSVRVPTGGTAVVVDLVMIERSAGVTVKGAVTDSLSNAYLIGVKLLLQQSAMSTWRTVDSGVTSSSGAFGFDSVAAGSYRIQASQTKYVTRTISFTVSTDTLTVNFKLLAIEVAKISGTITDSLSNANLTGAKIILQQSNSTGWKNIDSTASATGAFLFDSIEANTYRIQASMNGYTARTTASFTVSGTQTKTVDIKLLEVQSGKITGKITADSAKGAPVAGATVILEKVSTTVVAVDTETTDASGVYLFPTVETGLNYDLTISKTGYIEKTVRHSRQSAGTDTVNIAVQKIATGSFYVKVMKQADSAAVSGASVTAAKTGGAATSVTAGSNGVAAFTDLAAGTYSITISAAGCVPANRTGYQLAANAKDTVKFFMSVATGGTKVLMGTVTDSASKAGVANARIALTIQSGGVSFVLIDSTDANGAFIISGIPAAVYMGSVAATRANYHSYSNSQVTIGQPNQADTGRITVIMVKLPTAVLPHAALKAVAAGKPGISAIGAGRLKLSNFGENGVVSVVAVNGKVVYRAKIAANETILALPQTVTGGWYVVTVTQKNADFRQQVIMP